MIRPSSLPIQEIESRELGRLRLAKRTYPPLHRMPPHAHEEIGLSIVVAGEVEEVAGREAHLARAGSLVVKPAGVTHSNRFGPRGATLLAVAFKPAFMDGADAAPLGGLGNYGWRHDLAVGRVKAALRYMFQAAPLQSTDEIENGIFEALDFLSGNDDARGLARRPPGWVGRLQERLHADCAHPPGMRGLAAEIGLHPVYLARVFRRHLRCTLTEYVRRLRILAAAERLAASDEPPGHIALQLGFADQAHFCRVFKTQLGVTPLEYRRQARETRAVRRCCEKLKI